ncbi:carboxypeptidase-like regulatory domain-containing protein [Hymenobacter wooponensis]|uniref:Carboxypeptidase-like regulatory domain-containing protein n=1 Tax=Hymenobacter wooponensis TaxID=1525360 RepID=A0A4Z0MGG3_9BACT|nr:carboxypeptidase-like regulatory domain-containing protein [Hymenobacter wooponensis]TGD78569.1 carboxypeptidase-like regulatory domain-containing protein [Hymenobacter wooponensis]
MPIRPTLSVPKPCHENWQAMTPAAQGRHCAACDKVVVDFTRMTDMEILVYLGQSSGTSCGRFRREQLNRPLVAPVAVATWRKRWVALAAMIGLGTTAASTQGRAQQPPRPVRVPQTITLGMVASQPSVSPIPTPLPPLLVRGVIVDSATHELLPGVTVLLADTNIGISTDAQGEFELLLPDSYRQSTSVKLLISYVGYEGQQLQLNPHTATQQTITLAASTRLLGELIVVGGIQAAPWYTPRSLWWRLTRPFRQL